MCDLVFGLKQKQASSRKFSSGQKTKKKALVSEKNLHPGGRKFIFFNRFSGDILYSFLVSFAFFVFLSFLFVCLFFEIKNVYSYRYSTTRTGEWFFTRRISGKKTTFFGANGQWKERNLFSKTMLGFSKTALRLIDRYLFIWGRLKSKQLFLRSLLTAILFGNYLENWSIVF